MDICHESAPFIGSGEKSKPVVATTLACGGWLAACCLQVCQVPLYVVVGQR